MNRITQVICLVAGLVVGFELCVSLPTSIRYSMRFTVTFDPPLTEEQAVTVRVAARSAFILKEKEHIEMLPGPSNQLVVRLSDVTRDDLIWILGRDLNNYIWPMKQSEAPSFRTRDVGVVCWPYLPPLALGWAIAGLGFIFFCGWGFRHGTLRSNTNVNQTDGGPQQPAGADPAGPGPAQP